MGNTFYKGIMPRSLRKPEILEEQSVSILRVEEKAKQETGVNRALLAAKNEVDGKKNLALDMILIQIPLPTIFTLYCLRLIFMSSLASQMAFPQEIS
jgi:hypothetical protein